MIQVNFYGNLIRQLGAYLYTDKSGVATVEGTPSGVMGMVGLAAGGPKGKPFEVSGVEDAVNKIKGGPLFYHALAAMAAGVQTIVCVRAGDPQEAKVTLAQEAPPYSAAAEGTPPAGAVLVSGEVLPTGGSLPPGSYDYAVRSLGPSGKGAAVALGGVALTAGESVRLSINHTGDAVAFEVWRKLSADPDSAYALVGRVLKAETGDTVFTDTGAPYALALRLVAREAGSLFSKHDTWSYNDLTQSWAKVEAGVRVVVNQPATGQKSITVEYVDPAGVVVYSKTYKSRLAGSGEIESWNLLDIADALAADRYVRAEVLQGGAVVYDPASSDEPETSLSQGAVRPSELLFGEADLVSGGETATFWLEGGSDGVESNDNVVEALALLKQRPDISIVAPAPSYVGVKAVGQHVYWKNAPDGRPNLYAIRNSAPDGASAQTTAGWAAALLAHAAECSSVTGRAERIVFIPFELRLDKGNDEYVLIAQDFANGVRSELAHVIVGETYTALLNGRNELVGPSIVNAVAAGLVAGSSPAYSLSFKIPPYLSKGYRDWSVPNKNDLIAGRVNFLENYWDLGVTKTRFHHYPTASVSPSNQAFQEMIYTRTVHHANRFVRDNTQRQFTGNVSLGGATAGKITAYVGSLLDRLKLDGLIAAYANVKVEPYPGDPTAFDVSYELQPVSEVKFILITNRINLGLA